MNLNSEGSKLCIDFITNSILCFLIGYCIRDYKEKLKII